MGFGDLFAGIVGNFRRHYLDLTEALNHGRKPYHYGGHRVEQSQHQPQRVDRFDSSETPVEETPVDEYVPEEKATVTRKDSDADTKPTAKSNCSDKNSPADCKGNDDDNAAQAPEVAQNPDGTYYYQRSARLDYRLDLQFDLATFTQTVQEIADGDTTSLDQLAAAGFGLHADFDVHGYQKVKTNMTEGDGDTRSLSRSRTRGSMRRAGAFAVQSRDFNMQSFYREALKVRSGLTEAVHGNHRAAVNRFALRYRFDSNFSFSFAQRFNVQTQRVADEQSDALAGYLDNAGAVAEKGTSQMMASFFDAVESYLNQAETKMSASTSEFLAAAGAELGFDGAMLEAAKDHLADSIEGFFGRVQSALDGLQEFYGVTPAETVPEAAELPQANTTPVDLPAAYQQNDLSKQAEAVAVA